MKLGISAALPHKSPDEWAQKHKALGLEAVVFPCDHHADVRTIDAYASACKQYGLTIAEVGAWSNMMHPHQAEREKNIAYNLHQLELADYVQAVCCVNISGAAGDVWDGGYAENYSKKTYEQIVRNVQYLIDQVNPRYACYSLEPMPWMVPDSPDSYLQLIQDVNRTHFAAHMDMINWINDPHKYFFNAEYTRAAFAKLGNHIKSCHLKDSRLQTSLTLHLKEVPCGEGNFDLKTYIQEADKASCDMPMIIEHLQSEEEYLASIRYIQALNASLSTGKDA